MKMIRAKGHKAVRTTKVKGHATDAMIEEGLVRKEDKKGNDEADEAAGKGAKGAQERLADLVATYSGKHKRYKALVERIHVFMLKMTNLEKEAKREKEQEDKVQNFAEGGTGGRKGCKEKVLCIVLLNRCQYFIPFS